MLLGASLATFFGRLLSVGAPDLRGALRLDFDSASWIGTIYNMGLMFIGPFSVYLGGLLGPKRVLFVSATIFTLLCIVMPFAGHLPVLLFLLATAGMTAGTFYPLTLSSILRNLPQSYLHLGIAAYAADIVITTHMAHSYEGWLMGAVSWQWIFWTTALLTPIMHAQSATQDIAAGRVAVLFAGSIRQQAFTLSIMDAFTLIACVATACLLIIACLQGLKVGFRQIIATSAKSAS
ncbi:MFS transporter [Tunturiibacter empetritectus]|uniref:MFS transporter n=1 Tax=Tunturiibacter empetritectus TaxID=3069691 RepID=UPI003D9B95EA